MAIQVEILTEDFTGLISQSEYEEYLRFDGTDQDNVLPFMVVSAIKMAEHFCNASFGNKTIKYQNDSVIAGLKYWLPFPKINSITSVKLNGVALSEGTDYVIGGLENKYLIFINGGTGFNHDIFEVEYSAGYLTPADVNGGIKEGILGILSENFEHRQDSIDGSVHILPRNSRVKLQPYKNPQFT